MKWIAPALAVFMLCAVASVGSATLAGSVAHAQQADDDPMPVAANGGIIIQRPSVLADVSHAVPAPDLEKDPGGFVASMLAAANAGYWRLLAGGLLIVVVWLARRFGAKWVPWFATDRGGAALVLALALAGGLATTLVEGAPLSFGLLVNSLAMAFTAAGGWAVLKKLLAPSDAK